MEEAGTDVTDMFFGDQPKDEFLGILSLSILEVKSALNRLVKGGVVREDQAGEFRENFRKDLSQIAFITPLNEEIVGSAISLADRHPLRAGDMLHLAAIVQFREMARRANDLLVVISSDSELNRACNTEGVQVLDPADADAIERLKRIRARI